MKRVLLPMFVLLLLFLFAACIGDTKNVPSDDPPTTTGTGDSQILTGKDKGPVFDSLVSSTVFSVFDGETYVKIPLQFGASYSEGSGIHADGILMFSGVGHIIRTNDLPEIVYGDRYEIRYDEPTGCQTTVELTVYRDLGSEEPERLPQYTDLSSLEPGRYVLEYIYKITRDNDYNIRSAIFWLLVE